MTEPASGKPPQTLPVGCAVFAVLFLVLMMFGAALVFRNGAPAPIQAPAATTGR